MLLIQHYSSPTLLYSGIVLSNLTGDCFRLGSVGLVVSEMRGEDDEVQKLDARTLEFLKDEALAFEGKGDIALSATEEAEGLLKAERGGER